MTKHSRRGLAILLTAVVLSSTLAELRADPAERTAAAAPIARVIQQSGRVEVRREQAEPASHLGRRLYAGDSVVTGQGGRVVLEFTDRTLLALGADTDVWLDDCKVGSQSGGLKDLLSLLGGILRTSIVQSTRAEDFRIRSETAIASVRSTDWIVEAQPSETPVLVLSGVVPVAESAQSASVRVSAGEGTSVAASTAPKIWGAKRAADPLSRTGIE